MAVVASLAERPKAIACGIHGTEDYLEVMSMVNLANLPSLEAEGIVVSLASLAYVRSQGRSLPEDSQEKFTHVIRSVVWPGLAEIRTTEEFDVAHDAWVQRLCATLGNDESTPRPYGQGQKSLNVWLKFYVDYASRPDIDVARRLRPWLHCPLDSVVMAGLKGRYPEEYRRRIEPHYVRLGVVYQRRHSLTMIDKELYDAWQSWIKDLSPAKPVLIDLLWAFER